MYQHPVAMVQAQPVEGQMMMMQPNGQPMMMIQPNGQPMMMQYDANGQMMMQQQQQQQYHHYQQQQFQQQQYQQPTMGASLAVSGKPVLQVQAQVADHKPRNTVIVEEKYCGGISWVIGILLAFIFPPFCIFVPCCPCDTKSVVVPT